MPDAKKIITIGAIALAFVAIASRVPQIRRIVFNVA